MLDFMKGGGAFIRALREILQPERDEESVNVRAFARIIWYICPNNLYIIASANSAHVEVHNKIGWYFLEDRPTGSVAGLKSYHLQHQKSRQQNLCLQNFQNNLSNLYHIENLRIQRVKGKQCRPR